VKEIIPLKDRLRIHPFTDSLNDLTHLHGSSWPVHGFYFLTNVFVNIILFIPFSFIAIIVFRIHRFVSVVLLSCLLSVMIEIIQYCTGLGVADADDVILNTAGAAIGFYLCKRYLNKQ
jgi:glycopeptide antibiotics resistance protein